MSGEGDVMLARLKRLPVRLRIAHLAALLRHARALSYPSPREAAGREGRNEVKARVGGVSVLPDNPQPDTRFARVDLESELARLGPRKGEGSKKGGRAG
jgi:hypothetical protein